MKIVIIGGVAAGATAATKIKRQMGDKVKVKIFEMSSDISYANCALPYSLNNHIPEDQIIHETKESMDKRGIKVFTNHKVVNIFQNDNTIQVKDLKNNKLSKYSYDKLILAMGSKPIELPIEGIQTEKELYHF